MKELLIHHLFRDFKHGRIAIDNEGNDNMLLVNTLLDEARGPRATPAAMCDLAAYRYFYRASHRGWNFSNIAPEMKTIKTKDFFMSYFNGELVGFPQHIVERMLEHQVAQGNPRNLEIFEKHASRIRITGGFDWDKTPEGQKFWYEVIEKKNFSIALPSKTERFPFLLKPEHQKDIIQIACKSWRKTLIDRWGIDFFTNNSVFVSKEFYLEMRKACTAEQHMLFNKIFGTDEVHPANGTPCLIYTNENGWLFRYATGDGTFYTSGRKKGVAGDYNVKQWRVLDMNNLPE